MAIVIYRPSKDVDSIEDQESLNSMLKCDQVESKLIDEDELDAYKAAYFVTNPIDLIGFNKAALVAETKKKAKSAIKDDPIQFTIDQVSQDQSISVDPTQEVAAGK